MTPEIRKILFTSDLTETSKHAFTYALSLAARYHASIILLFVLERVNPNIKPLLDPELLEPIRKTFVKEARTTLTGKRKDLLMLRSGLEQFCNVTLKELDYAGEAPDANEVLVAEGNVVDTIIRTAKEKNCDAIVLGSRRRRAVSEFMFGSVVKEVLRRSDCLVVVAPPLKAS